MMNYKKACENLNISKTDEITNELLKRKYRLGALAFHPDKNTSPDASSKFQDIHESYEYLLKYLKLGESNEEEDFEEDDNDSFDADEGSLPRTGYRWILYSFLKNAMKNENHDTLFYMIIQKISNKCEKQAIEMLEKIDKTILIKICGILKNYREVFHFSNAFFDKIDEIVTASVKIKNKNEEYIILNPLLKDIFENNLYKLSVDDFKYIVPLWHHELIYDHSGNDITVKCYPMLPENIQIDEKNNLHVVLKYSMDELFVSETIEFFIDKKIFSFKPSELYIRKKQTLVLKRQGISRINVNDIYDISQKSDIVLHVEII